jgi:hypothetical protein
MHESVLRQLAKLLNQYLLANVGRLTAGKVILIP